MLGLFFRGNVFLGSDRLVELVNDHDYDLYDVTRMYGRKMPFILPEIKRNGPTPILKKSHEYILVPQAKEGQTLEEAVAETGFLGPTICLPPLNDQEICFYNEGKLIHGDLNLIGSGGMTLDKQIFGKFFGSFAYIFSRLRFQPDKLVATSPRGLFRPKEQDAVFEDVRPPRVEIPYREVIDIFTKYFTVVGQEDLLLSAYISSQNDN